MKVPLISLNIFGDDKFGNRLYSMVLYESINEINNRLFHIFLTDNADGWRMKANSGKIEYMPKPKPEIKSSTLSNLRLANDDKGGNIHSHGDGIFITGRDVVLFPSELTRLIDDAKSTLSGKFVNNDRSYKTMTKQELSIENRDRVFKEAKEFYDDEIKRFRMIKND